MAHLTYQRAVVGYHGCDAAVAEKVLAGNAELMLSTNAYDWLGEGVYFWEHGPLRAYAWAGTRHSEILSLISSGHDGGIERASGHGFLALGGGSSDHGALHQSDTSGLEGWSKTSQAPCAPLQRELENV